MKKRTFLLTGTITALLLAGCQTNDAAAENEALKQRIAKLEQQITELEQKNTEMMDNNAANVSSDDIQTTGTVSQNVTSDAETSNSYTTEELTAMVEDFAAKADTVTPDASNPQNLEQFFTLKQEANQINNTLERYENSLEDQYRAGTLSREEYKNLDRELEKLEDQLDAAEDRLEVIFGIDD